MTNRGRANDLAVASRQEAVSCLDLANAIERALDDAEKRGYQMGFIEAESSKHDLTDHMKSWARGQKHMRERAAKLLEDFACEVCKQAEGAIRALPIEGE